MLRKTLTILSFIGLLLSVGLWGVSYFHIECARSGYVFTVVAGALSVIAMDDSKRKATPDFCRCHGFGGFQTDWIPEIGVPSGGKATIHRFYYFAPFRGWLWALDVPLWMPAILCAVMLSVSGFPLYRRQKRKKLCLCLKCGYNLHGLPEPRCPECGTPFEMSTKSEAVSSKAESSQQDATP